MHVRFSLAIAAALLSASVLTAAPPTAEEYLYSGRLAEGEKDLSARLAATPNDDPARFDLGVIQFFRAVEHLSQSFHRYGLAQTAFSRQIPLLRMPVPPNPKPDAIDYAGQRAIFQTLLDDLVKVELTLSKVSDGDFKARLRLAKVRLDLTGDGKPTPIVALLDGYFGAGWHTTEDFAVSFDAGDAHWLRGYCHLLSALAEVVLAYDFQEVFDHTAHLFFANPKTPFPFLTHRANPAEPFDVLTMVDAVAMVHLIRMPVAEKDRMKAALAHLQAMISESRAMWKCVLAETDDDHEWIPNPRQKGVTGTLVTQEMVAGWLRFLDEADAILAGRKLLPFWRGEGKKGLNLRRVFEDPRPLDLVLWVQGTAAVPYLEDGPVTAKETWQGFQRIFGGRFIGFALWFN